MSQSTSRKCDMENQFKILTFQSKISAKRNGIPVMYFSNIVEIKCFDITRTSSDFEIKKQPVCSSYPPCACHKRKSPCSFTPKRKSCDQAGRRQKSCPAKRPHNLASYPQEEEYISRSPNITQKPNSCKK